MDKRDFLMKKLSRTLIFFLIIFLAVFYCYFKIKVFTDDRYTQQDIFLYLLLTPKSLKEVPRISDDFYFIAHAQEFNGLQKSELIFRGVPASEIDVKIEKISNFIESYSDPHAVMSVFAELYNGQYELHVVYYDTKDDN